MLITMHIIYYTEHEYAAQRVLCHICKLVYAVIYLHACLNYISSNSLDDGACIDTICNCVRGLQLYGLYNLTYSYNYMYLFSWACVHHSITLRTIHAW